MTKKNTIILIILLTGWDLCAQHTDEHEHNQEHHEKHSHAHELGFSVASTWFLNEEELNASIHLHYVYTFPHKNFGLGVGYERVFDEHKHNFIGAELVYRPVHPLTLDLSPGIAFEGEHPGEPEFALHFETVYEFEFGAVHLGPMIEIAYHPEDWHFSLGVHLGFGL